MNHLFSRMWASTLSFKSSVMTAGHPDQASLYTSVLPPLNQATPLPHIPLVHDTLPIHSDKFTMDFGRVKLFMFKNWIAKHTSQSAGSLIDVVLYKTLWHSSQFTQWLGKHWGCCRGSDDSSQPWKPSRQCPAWAGCTNCSYFKNDPRNTYIHCLL
jgi:hypothetical protein